MGAGYTFALTAKTPFQAMNNFLVAVILVIVGTYCLFTAGSIAFIKLLRKNKKFYYQTKQFYKCIWNALQNEAKCSWAGQYMYSFNYGFNQRINYGVYVSWYGGYTEYGLP